VIVSVMANEVAIPGMGGGLVRYREEYNSKLKFGPGAVVGMVIATIVFIIGLRIYFS